MKWFKHISGSLNDSLIFEAIEKFGSDGYLVFFGILELMSDEFDIHNPGKNEISLKKIRKNLQISLSKTRKILAFFDKKAKINQKKNIGFYADVRCSMVYLNCPRLKELTDEYTKKQLQKLSGQTPDPNRDKLRPKEAEVEKEGEAEVEKEKKGSIYIPIFEFWNLQEIIVHKKCDDKIKRVIKSSLRYFSYNKIKEAIENYTTVLKSDKHYWTHKWTLVDFLKRGLDKFINEADPINNFIRRDPEESPMDKQLRKIENLNLGEEDGLDPDMEVKESE